MNVDEQVTAAGTCVVSTTVSDLTVAGVGPERYLAVTHQRFGTSTGKFSVRIPASKENRRVVVTVRILSGLFELQAMTTTEDVIEELRTRDTDGEGNPYEDVDTSVLPEWWQQAIAEFEAADLRPYRPPRLKNGAYKHRVVEDLESRYSVNIEFVGVGVSYGDDWTVRVDGEAIAEIGHRRSTQRFSIFEVSEGELRTLIADHTS